MDARESLAKRNHRSGYFCDHICADQWPIAEDFAVEPASCWFARGGVNGLDRRDDPHFAGSRTNVESAGPGDDFRRQSYDHRLGREYDRRGIRAGTS